ncbi:MAG: regulator of ime2 [Watsoniomyces obsoletus]|nr:MAG: regulator of ime2 [Watsoniomyces obsoletus]
MSSRPPPPTRTQRSTSGGRERLARFFSLDRGNSKGGGARPASAKPKFDRLGSSRSRSDSKRGNEEEQQQQQQQPLNHPHQQLQHHQATRLHEVSGGLSSSTFVASADDLGSDAPTPTPAPTHAPTRRPTLRFNTSATDFQDAGERYDRNPTPTGLVPPPQFGPAPLNATPLRPALKERANTGVSLYERAYHGPRNQTSFNWRAGQMAGVFDLERQRTRRERTFIGSECAVCEEPLEHTLRGERVLQFSCGHVSHEACFYEYIRQPDSQYCPTCSEPLGLDTSRGGNVLDLEKLSSIVRTAAANEYRTATRGNPSLAYEERPRSREGGGIRTQRRDYSRPYPSDRQEPYDRTERYDRHDSRQPHGRQGSETTGNSGPASVADYPEPPAPTGRRHDYDVHSMETNLSSPRTSVVKNPVPPPIVTVRSEFPTLTKSRQQQALTCLVTVEVPATHWKPDPDDVRGAVTASTSVAPRNADDPGSTTTRPTSPTPTTKSQPFYPTESPEVLEAVTENLRQRVDNWHGLDFRRFGKLRLYGNVRVGKDRQTWQELECYLFSEMLICVKEKRVALPSDWDDADVRPKTSRCTLKGSILIKKHLKQVTESSLQDAPILTLSLSVAELPSFHLQFHYRKQLEEWRRALLDLNGSDLSIVRTPGPEAADTSETDEEDYRTLKTTKRVSSVNSSYGAGRSVTTAPTEYTNSAKSMPTAPMPAPFHVPLDVVVVIPVSASMQGLKISLLRDALKFLVQQLGERDRMGLVTFGSGAGAVPVVGMTTRAWNGWAGVLNSIRPADRKSLRADVVEGANVAMDLLMQRRSNNPIASILLISDSSTSDTGDVSFVVSRAEAAKVAIHSFGLGLTHKPDTMIELSSRTKASYTYVKDWMMLRECVAGCLGSMQTLSHQNARLKMRLPEGSPARFVKIHGALQMTRRAGGRDAEAVLGDLRFGDKRDILVQLVIAPDNSSQENLPQDAWETIVSGLEALGGPTDAEDSRHSSVEEVPLIQAEVSYGDILRQGAVVTTRPSLLAITMLPRVSKTASNGRGLTPPIPPHPSIVQRRMELLTSDMLSRALTLVSKGQHERAQHLLNETRSILKGLGKGGLPPVPSSQASKALGALGAGNGVSSPSVNGDASPVTTAPETPDLRRSPSPPRSENKYAPAPGIDVATIQAIDAELESSLEWIGHPAVFGRDSRKAVLQAIGIISSQRAYTFRTPVESLWAGRIAGIKRLTALSREWRETDESLMEE